MVWVLPNTHPEMLRYVGSFVNGMYNGKGNYVFDDGAFLTGTWKTAS